MRLQRACQFFFPAVFGWPAIFERSSKLSQVSSLFFSPPQQLSQWAYWNKEIKMIKTTAQKTQHSAVSVPTRSCACWFCAVVLIMLNQLAQSLTLPRKSRTWCGVIQVIPRCKKEQIHGRKAWAHCQCNLLPVSQRCNAQFGDYHGCHTVHSNSILQMYLVSLHGIDLLHRYTSGKHWSFSACIKGLHWVQPKTPNSELLFCLCSALNGPYHRVSYNNT